MIMVGKKKHKRRGRIKQYAKGNTEKSIVDFYFARYREFSILFGGLKVTYIHVPRFRKQYPEAYLIPPVVCPTLELYLRIERKNFGGK